MKKAIITGSTGLVGIGLVNKIMNSGVDVLCLGSRNELRRSWLVCLGEKLITLLPPESFSDTKPR